MLLKWLGCLALLAFSDAHLVDEPKIFGPESAIVFNANESPSFRSSQEGAVGKFPVYQIVQSMPKLRQLQIAAEKRMKIEKKDKPVVQDEFPRELLDIAREKLGLKSLDEIPSLSQLAALLGTNSATETINYVKQLASTDQGIALIKAFIESSDYTDTTNENEDPASESNDYEDNNTMPNEANSHGVVQNFQEITTKSDQNENVGFLQKLVNFFNIYNLTPQHKTIIETEVKRFTTQPSRKLKSHAVLGSQQANVTDYYQKMAFKFATAANSTHKPMPYHYPMPLRPVLLPRYPVRMHRKQNNSTNTTTPAQWPRFLPPLPALLPPPAMLAPHLNTPRVVRLPQHIVEHLARITKIPQYELEKFLQSKPKLADLAIKIGSFPVSKEHSKLADDQILAAIKKVLDSDEDFKQLLSLSEILD